MAFQMVFVALPWFGSRVDSYVVHVDCYVPSIDEVPEYCVHHGLKGGRQVGEAEEHDRWFVEPLVSDECRFPSVLWFDEDFIIPPLNVNAGELRAVA